MTDAPADDAPSAPPRTLAWVVAVALVALAAMFFWKEMSQFRLEREFEHRLEAERAEIALRESRMHEAAVARVSEMLELLSFPLGWAVSGEAVRGDFARIEEHMLALIEQPSVRGACYVDSSGRVLLATDRTLQGADGRALFGDMLESSQSVLREVEGELRLMVPVVGRGERIGSFVVGLSAELLQPFTPPAA